LRKAKMKEEIITSFPCPECERTGRKRSWVLKRKKGGFYCPNCPYTAPSYEAAKIALDDLRKN